MWGSDYPHGDSIFPNSQQVLDELFSEHHEADRMKITAENAIKLYRLPFETGEVAAAAGANARA